MFGINTYVDKLHTKYFSKNVQFRKISPSEFCTFLKIQDVIFNVNSHLQFETQGRILKNQGIRDENPGGIT